MVEERKGILAVNLAEVVRAERNTEIEAFMAQQNNIFLEPREIDFWSRDPFRCVRAGTFVDSRAIPIVEDINYQGISNVGEINISFGGGMLTISDACFLDGESGRRGLTIAYDKGDHLDLSLFYAGQEILAEGGKIALPYLVVVNNWFDRREIENLAKKGAKMGTVLAVGPVFEDSMKILVGIASEVRDGLIRRDFPAS